MDEWKFLGLKRRIVLYTLDLLHDYTNNVNEKLMSERSESFKR